MSFDLIFVFFIACFIFGLWVAAAKDKYDNDNKK